MKKNIIRIISAALVLTIMCACCLGFTACKNGEKMFGKFRCYGHYLVQKGINKITAEAAKALTWKMDGQATESTDAKSSASFMSASFVGTGAETSGDTNVKPTDKDVVQSLMTRYQGFNTTTKYYEVDTGANKATEVTKTDEYIGPNCRSTLEENKLTPYAQMVANNIIAYDGLIDWFVARNAEFDALADKNDYPFSAPYSYWTDTNGNLVIQTHKFVSIDPNYTGGIACYYLQDSEIVYDSEGKLTLWQTSLGVAYASTTGTAKEGFIMTIEVDWIEKE